MTQLKKTSSGFTLIELGMVLVVIGFVIGPIFTYLTIQRDQESYRVTVERQKKIANVLSNYSQTFGYLPCPSRPVTGIGDGTSGLLGWPLTRCDNIAFPTRRKGIVPYRVLGLTQEDVIDGYGNAFTYIVSQAANDIRENNPDATTSVSVPSVDVHTNCSLANPNWNAPWVRSESDPSIMSPTMNIKARFCCRLVNTVSEPRQTIDVFSNAARTLRPIPTRSKWVDTTEGNPSYVDTTETWDNSLSMLRYFAYAVISHGKNGEGAYMINSTNTRPWKSAGDSERINGFISDGDARGYQVMDLPISTRRGATYFDDIVLWRTQETTMSETGNNSCILP